MCEIKHDEVERLMVLRRDFRESFDQSMKEKGRYGYGSAADREAAGRAGAWNMAAILVEERIVEALGYDPKAVSHKTAEGDR